MIPKILVDRPQQNKSNSELRKSVEILNVISYYEEVLWCYITERKQKTSDLPGWRPEHESTFKNIPSITDWNDGNNVSRHPICVSRESVTFRSMQTKNCLSQAKPKASRTKQKLALEFATELWRTKNVIHVSPPRHSKCFLGRRKIGSVECLLPCCRQIGLAAARNWIALARKYDS